jgi:hypothetical protein
MKPINKDELYEHLSQFLRTRGVELKPGSYSQGIQKGCGLLTDTINISQQGLKRAKVELDKKLDQMRKVIHEKTAPAQPKSSPASAPRQAPKAKKQSPTKPKPRAKRG